MDVRDEVIISDRGGGNATRIEIASPQASWLLNESGQFSCYTTIDILRRAGLGGELKGKWLWWVSPAGIFGGVITGRPMTGTVAEISAEGWASLLRGRVLIGGDQAIAPPASLAVRVLRSASASQATFITIGTIEEGGQDLGVLMTGDVADDILPNLADAGDMEWRIDADRKFHAGRKLGRDLSGSIRFLENRNFGNVQIADDLWYAASVVLQISEVTNVAAFGANATNAPTTPTTSYGPAPVHLPSWGLIGGQALPGEDTTLENMAPLPTGIGGQRPNDGLGAGLVETIRQIQEGATYAPAGWGGSAQLSPSAPPPWQGVAPGIGANNVAVPSTRHLPPPTIPISGDLTNVDGIFGEFDIGDTVKLELGSIGFVGRFRVLAKAIDGASGILSVSGDAMIDY